ncbi:MAG TPA: phosphoglycerate dehydrogenase [Clostridia bacterium]|jgi:D-3-phosphoglycerate dehydrogenase|nr:phosphoglycerate dehydrogenase [Clostridia bacterium]
MKILVSDPLSFEGIEALQKEADVDVITKLSEDELIEIIGNYDGLVVRSGTQVTERIIEHAHKLKVIGRAGVGVDNIDLDAATRRGIVVLNAPEGNTVAAAEHTIAMMMSLARNIPAANASLKAGEWRRNDFMGIEIRDKIIGIIGIGKIGTEVARRAIGLGMKVLGYDPFITPERAKSLGVELVELPELYKRSDFITVHTPLTKESRSMISAKEFAIMKDGVRIINCARGGIINEQDLYDALVSGKIAGAALDVFVEEPPKNNPLLTLDNVIVTPHLGASTKEAQVNVAVEAAEGVIQVLKGAIVTNAVNIPTLPAEVLAVIEPYLPLAEKLGKFMAQIFEGQVRSIKLLYSGIISKQEVGPLTNAVLKGFLRPSMQDAVNAVNAPIIAKERGIKVTESKVSEEEDFASLITICVYTDKGEYTAAGTLFGRKDPRIVKINGYRVDAFPSEHMLVVMHTDRPGIIGRVGMLLGKENINIAGMQVGREEVGGEAIMVMEVDSSVPDRILEEIEQIDGIKKVDQINL